mgnify:CR=1 FL=1
MSIETGALVGLDGLPIYWHLPPGRNAGYLPDSQDLWSHIWKDRDVLQGFAHSHPGFGTPSPSWEDLTTFSAIEKALGKRLTWWIITANQVAEYTWSGPGTYDYIGCVLPYDTSQLVWLDQLHSNSYEEDIAHG